MASPQAQRRRRTRAWIIAVLCSLAVAVLVGSLIPVGEARVTDASASGRHR
jgi:hypothetical protein